MKTKRVALAAALALVAAPFIAYAGGSWQTWAVIGGASYCASTSTTSTGQACTQTVPAGPTAFTGSEVVPADLFAPGTNNGVPVNSALIDIQQLGQGSAVNLTTVASTTFVAGQSFMFVDGTDASAYTITLPPNPVEGQFAEVVCSAATAGAMTVAANAAPASTVLLPAFSAAACTAGNTFKYRYGAAANTWFRV